MDKTGRSAFADEASQINENLFSFRSDIDSVRGQNAQLKQEARTADYTEVLKSVGQEVGVRTFNELLSKYGGKVYRYKTSGGSLADLDERFGQGVKDAIGQGVNALSIRQNKRPQGVELVGDGDMGVERTRMDGLGGEGTTMTGLGDEAIPLKSSMRTAVVENESMNPDTVHTDESFESFMNDRIQQIPRTQSGKIDFDSASSSVYDLNQSSASMPSPEDSIGHDTHAELGNQNALELESGEDAVAQSTFSSALQATTDQARNEGARLLGAGGQVVDDFTEAASKAGGKIAGAIGEGVEGIGAALDATGVLAPIGALVGAAGATLDIAGLYQVGKGVVDWFDEDILQKKPPSAPQITLPSQPYTISQRGMGIVPNMDSLNLPSSISSGW